MKKVLTIFMLLLILFITYLLQFTVFAKYTMFNVLANIVIIFFIFLATYSNKIYSYIIAIIYGFLVDIRYANPVGGTVFALILIIELTVRLNSLLYVNSRLATMIKVFILTIVFEFAKYMIRVIILTFDVELLEFFKIVSIQAIYNMLIIMVVYPIFKYGGELVNEILNKKNILTRYF